MAAALVAPNAEALGKGWAGGSESKFNPLPNGPVVCALDPPVLLLPRPKDLNSDMLTPGQNTDLAQMRRKSGVWMNSALDDNESALWCVMDEFCPGRQDMPHRSSMSLPWMKTLRCSMQMQTPMSLRWCQEPRPVHPARDQKATSTSHERSPQSLCQALCSAYLPRSRNEFGGHARLTFRCSIS